MELTGKALVVVENALRNQAIELRKAALAAPAGSRERAVFEAEASYVERLTDEVEGVL
jgi:hypothetical protein